MTRLRAATLLRALCLAVVTALVGGCRRAPEGPTDSVLADARRQLAARGTEDQAVREGFGEGGKIDTAQIRRMMHVDSANTTWLKAYVARWQWPTAQQVGKENVEGAFLIVQHAIHDTAFMRAMLPAVTQAAKAGDLKPSDVALLGDRVEVKAGHGQRYGTQFSIRDGRLVLDPIEDSAHVDERRAALGLMPIAQYIHMVDSAMKMPPAKP